MTKTNTKKYLISAALLIPASVACKIAYDIFDRLPFEVAYAFELAVKILATLLLLLATANYIYQFYKTCDSYDEFIKYNVMKGACFGGIMTAAVSWIYSCFGFSVPQYQAEWPFYMLLVFTAIGHSYFIRKAS